MVEMKRDLAGAAVMFAMMALVVLATIAFASTRARGAEPSWLAPAQWKSLDQLVPNVVVPIVPVKSCKIGFEVCGGKCLPDCREGLCKRRRVA